MRTYTVFIPNVVAFDGQLTITVFESFVQSRSYAREHLDLTELEIEAASVEEAKFKATCEFDEMLELYTAFRTDGNYHLRTVDAW